MLKVGATTPAIIAYVAIHVVAMVRYNIILIIILQFVGMSYTSSCYRCK